MIIELYKIPTNQHLRLVSKRLRMNQLPTSPYKSSRRHALLDLLLRPRSQVVQMLLFAGESFIEVLKAMDSEIITSQECFVRILAAG